MGTTDAYQVKNGFPFGDLETVDPYNRCPEAQLNLAIFVRHNVPDSTCPNSGLFNLISVLKRKGGEGQRMCSHPIILGLNHNA